ncbi:putative beta-mannosidase [Microthyrium microscopicum]|uniref:Beta-mannosidase B n=1 Tax=Microthyrium microscopicum TaxID=703497 RepID=A0A6A6U160_9PEZI|nr:putative beta-mannosidase [Microthyrium microscopicum]
MGDQIFTLESGWEFKETSGEHVPSWLSVSTVPTNVHLDLMNHKLIEDPFIDFNELKCEWVAETSWTYRTKLPSVPSLEPGSIAMLSFEGLDTFATVTLDGEEILKSDNMFHSHRIDVTSQLSKSGVHELEIFFDSAFQRARQIKKAHPKHEWVGFNGDMGRLAVRKAQYHWGWDWGPVLCPCGPWRPVRLEIFRSQVTEVRVDYTVSPALDQVHGTINAQIQGDLSHSAHCTMTRNGRSILEQDVKPDKTGSVKVPFSIKDPDLWYPFGYGEANLYEIKVSTGSEVSTVTKTFGFRKLELIQEKDKIGKSFYFRVNNIDVFCGGSNWIPADSFTPRVSADTYRKWLQMMVDGHQNMIRVWGGGIYEEDVFFDICDELGVLVWHDFMFGCGNYPAYPEILDSIRHEADQNVKRIRHHPCIAIFAGNNEDYQVQESFNLTYNYEDKDPESWLKTNFPARYIYEKILPEVMAEHAPWIPYHPGSPWGDGLESANPTIGDMHQWNVWHGTQEKYQIFDTLGGRFNSEFGMEAFPHIGTIKAYCTNPDELYPQSRTLDFHNKADRHERRIATYLVENFRNVPSLEGYIHLSQMVQAEALMFGYRGWRQQWGKERHCGGALVWQLNDCWPVTSWSIVDYYQRKKPAYYTMRRVLAPLAVAVKREHWDWSVVHARPPKELSFECWVASKEQKAIKGRVELRFISIATGKDIKAAISKEVTITPNGTTDVFQGSINEHTDEPHVLAARLFVDDAIVARDSDWPQPLKYLSFKHRDVKVKYDSKGSVTVSSARPAKGFVFEEREGVLVDDSAIDIMPGDEQTIRVRGLNGDVPELGWRYLGADES